MRVLVHFRVLRDTLLNFFETPQPCEQLDRVAEVLKGRNPEVYVSAWGLQSIQRDLAYYCSRPDVPYKVAEMLGQFLQIAPLSEQKKVENLVHLQGTVLSPETFEFHQACEISADAILTGNPRSFSQFNLSVSYLSHQTDLSAIKQVSIISTLPILLVGEFSDLWFLVDSAQKITGLVCPPQTLHSSQPVLTQWLRDDWSQLGWYLPKEVPDLFRSRTPCRKKITSRVKLIPIRSGSLKSEETVALSVAIEKRHLTYQVSIELTASIMGYVLPYPLSLKVMDENGKCAIEQSTLNKTRIQFEIEVKKSEKFSVVIGNRSFKHKEDFIV
ncbi:MAG: DUF1822 family protein [Leptolyngbya sp. SIO1E4]|nr:DUF1822 family protein [Leptolyngbya sp. SIO1E4]